MPKSQKQRRAAFAELASRSKGKSKGKFTGMDKGELKEYAHAPLDKGGKSKPKGKGKKANPFSARTQAAALR